MEAVSEPCVKEVQKISLEVFHKCFTMKDTQVTQTGWRGVNGFLSDSNKDEADICEALPSLPKGSTLKIKSVEILSKTTQPPALYTEAGLLSAMETAGRDLESKQQRQLLQGSGIGTPATRAAIIETLLKRGYVVRKQKSLIPTEKGMQVYHWVKEDDIANVTLTGQWEEDLQKIEQGEKSPTEFLQAMKSYTQDLTQALLKLTNNGRLANDPHLAVTNFLNALEKIPSMIEKQQKEIAVIEKDLPVLKEVVSKEWTKENTLNELKNELTSIDRKIQLSIAPVKEEVKENEKGKEKRKENKRVVKI
ncbi:DNA topoisomerase [Capnocytophaga stomatis]|uniref:DNA topoisomerase n=1 Tax=Capnocytophaga stomatis TaxID=1848904 RepID=A0ABW8QDT7_9FLAO